MRVILRNKCYRAQKNWASLIKDFNTHYISKKIATIQVEEPPYPSASPLPPVRFLNVSVIDCYYYKCKDINSVFQNHCGASCCMVNNAGVGYLLNKKTHQYLPHVWMHMINIKKSRTCFLFVFYVQNVNSFTWNQYEFDWRQTNSFEYASGRKFDDWCNTQFDSMKTLVFRFLDLVFYIIHDASLRSAFLSSFNWLAEMQRGEDAYVETLKIIYDDPLKKLCSNAADHFSAYYATGETQPELTYAQFYHQ